LILLPPWTLCLNDNVAPWPNGGIEVNLRSSKQIRAGMGQQVEFCICDGAPMTVSPIDTSQDLSIGRYFEFSFHSIPPVAMI
jgi:hypothetical protein